MRYGIFSDVHSNLEALNAVGEAYQKETIEQYLCAGDIVGYGANPLECIEKVKAQVKVTVGGNHDLASVDLFSLDYFNPYATQAVLWTKKKLDNQNRYFLTTLKLVYKNKDLTLVHGTLDNPKYFNYMSDGYAALTTFMLMETQVCFVGHSHVAGIFTMDKENNIYYSQKSAVEIKDDAKYIVNVGSVGQPRDRDPRACYCIYDSGKKEIQIKRIDYDIQAAKKKIINHGLPHFLAERLTTGN